MNAEHEAHAEIYRLTAALLDDALDGPRREELAALLRADPSCRAIYLELIEAHAVLRGELAALPAAAAAVIDQAVASAERSETPILAPLRRLFDYFQLPSHFALLFATLALVSILLVLAQIRIDFSRPTPTPVERPRDASAVAGRVVAIRAATWAEAGPRLQANDLLQRDDRFELLAGTIELQFNRGASVVLEGPADFAIENPQELVLLRGRLTAVVPPRAVGFTVRTPQVLIVDLGTEFSVIVGDQAQTDVHVHRGAVQIAAPHATGAPHVVRQGSAVRVLAGAAQANVLQANHDLALRLLSRARFESLDVVDLAAGGDGLGKAGERGFNLTTGEVANEFVNEEVRSHGDYYLQPEVKYVDGVFLPNGTAGPVQTDSAGHAFALPATGGLSWGRIWAWGPPDPLAATDKGPWIRTLREPRRMLALHANAGITFDLDALRKDHPNRQLFNFFCGMSNAQAAIGEGQRADAADVWVLVDGAPRWSRRAVPISPHVFQIEVPLTDADRFLTLIATDSEGDYRYDVVVFFDPRIHFTRADPPLP